jgi:hypothetical protein
MTDEEALAKYAAMEEYFGELPNFEHHPRQFAYYVRMYDYYNSRLDIIPEVE